LKEKLLASALEPEGFAIPLRNMRAEAELFQEANLPLLADEQKTGNEYDKIIGAQTVVWEGQETTLSQLQPVFQDPDRAKRERAWRLSMERRLADRAAINAVWAQVLRVRLNIAENAGFGRDYRAYRWRQQLRFDYSPEDSKSFQRAIEAVVVPAAARRYKRRRQRLGLRPPPLGLSVDNSATALRPYTTIAELNEKTSAIFHQVDLNWRAL
jgi:oligoendopeptidase F